VFERLPTFLTKIGGSFRATIEIRGQGKYQRRIAITNVPFGSLQVTRGGCFFQGITQPKDSIFGLSPFRTPPSTFNLSVDCPIKSSAIGATLTTGNQSESVGQMKSFKLKQVFSHFLTPGKYQSLPPTYLTYQRAKEKLAH
jgi:hypothetical protein